MNAELITFAATPALATTIAWAVYRLLSQVLRQRFLWRVYNADVLLDDEFSRLIVPGGHWRLRLVDMRPPQERLMTSNHTPKDQGLVLETTR
jgi:hypothetical protein